MTAVRCFFTLIGFVLAIPSLRAQSVDVERARIESQRQQMQREFDIQVGDCYAKFAVNRCLNQVNIKHREGLADLRRQEISMNDDERKKRGAEQIRRVEEKLSATSRQKQLDEKAQMLSEYQQQSIRQQRLEKRPEKPSSPETQLEESPPDKKAQREQRSSDRRFAPNIDKTEQYLSRQREARERRIKHDADASKKPASKAKPLPVPP